MLFIPVFAENETVSSGDQGAADLSGGQQVIIAPTDTPTPDVTTEATTIPTTVPTTVPTTLPTIEPTEVPTTIPVTDEPTEIPTTVPTTDVTVEPTTSPLVNESASSPPVDDTPVVNETPGDPSPGENTGGNFTITDIPENNGTICSPDPVPGNTTLVLAGTPAPLPDLNLTNTTPDTCTPSVTNLSWSDPPLNTSADNPYYLNNNGWVIDHQETLDDGPERE